MSCPAQLPCCSPEHILGYACEYDFHLIELESVRLLEPVGGDVLVAIQNLGDEVLPLALWQAAGPWNESGPSEIDECLAGFEIPAFVVYTEVEDLK